MTELTIKVDDSLALRFKEIAAKKFRGNDSLAFEHALKSLLSDDERDLVRLEQIVHQIQDEIKKTGGVTGKEIDAYIAAYRLRKNKAAEI